MRLPLASDLKTRTGAPEGKDARLKNAYVETRGEQSVVRKRPCAQGGVVVGSGVPQGGYGTVLFWADTPVVITTATFTTWSSATAYVIGDHVVVDMVDYWALADNTNSQPPNGNWSRDYVPAVPAAIQYSVVSGSLVYNGTPTLIDALTATIIGAADYDSNHSSGTFAGLVSLVVADVYATTPTVTGAYGGSIGGVVVTGSWSSPIDLSGLSWDENPSFEIDGTQQNVTSTDCTRLDLIPNGTVIGTMGNQGQNNAWEGQFFTHP